jgi:hypothetical protein
MTEKSVANHLSYDYWRLPIRSEESSLSLYENYTKLRKRKTLRIMAALFLHRKILVSEALLVYPREFMFIIPQ